MDIEVSIVKGYLIIDDISLDEAKELMKQLQKQGRWFSESAMVKIDNATAFAVLTHGFPKVEDHEIHEFVGENNE